MADLELTRVDFARGLAVKNLVVPPMLARVVIPNARPELQKAFEKQKVVQQKVMLAAFEALENARGRVHSAIEQFDAGIGRRPPASEKEAEERAKTFNTVCKQIAEAQCGVPIKAATTAWQTQPRCYGAPPAAPARSSEEALAQLRARRKALGAPAVPAIAVARDPVIEAVAQRARQVAQRGKPSPAPAEPAEHLEARVAPEPVPVAV
jgi:hypothetical protein